MTSPDEEKQYVLVVDDDPDIVRFVQLNLTMEGLEVSTAPDGEAALAAIAERRPDLAIIDVMMPRLGGLDLAGRLRADPMTASMPIIMLTAKGTTADKVIGLGAGADDYLVKPFDIMELVARVRSTLRRNQEYREVSPLTGLPGNNRILREIRDRMRTGADYAVCHIDIDRFKSVNDVYGFGRGDEFISALARSLHRAVVHVGLPPAFIGHIGGDDFVVVCHPDQLRPMTERTVVDFETAADALYDQADSERGYILVQKRTSEVTPVNLVTLSIGVALSTSRTYTDPREVVAMASELKTAAKTHNGSYVAVDRRRGTDPRTTGVL